MNMTIRDATASDMEGITAIYNWAIRNTNATFDINEQTLEQRMEWFSHYGGAHPLIVADMEGTIAGYCCLSKFREKEAYSRTVEISVYIHPDCHGRGIGTALAGEIVDRARSLGHHVIVAGITAGNDISVRIHEKLGFRLCADMKEVGWKFGKWQDVRFYQLML